jgi:tetratricopeptide (TPR) repeat protein
LAIAYFNVRRDAAAALHAFENALASEPEDARLLYESDQLRKRLKYPAEARLAELLGQRALVDSRDDLTVELATLFNQLQRPQEALTILLSRQFQPWEGGEGLVLSQFTEAKLGLGQAALHQHRVGEALSHFKGALNPPATLGEARHLLANTSNIYYWLGRAYEAMGDEAQSARHYGRSAAQRTDFQAMAVQPFSEMNFWSGLAMQRLGQVREANALFEAMLSYGIELEQQKAKIDYFATSLPSLLLFKEDLDERQTIKARLLQAAALSGLGRNAEALRLLNLIVEAEPHHLFAAALASRS